MKGVFRNRTDAGLRLGALLVRYEGRADVLVLGLPRGGVPVAAEVARILRAPLDVYGVRKLGVPGNPELAMGAIATGGVMVLNREVVDRLGIPVEAVERVAATERSELERRERAYRGERPAPEVAGLVVILVDDGIATGSTMRAAVAALKSQAPARIVVAAPTIAGATFRELLREVDEVEAVIAPEEFYAVGQWYEHFEPTEDREVRALLGDG